MDKGCKKCHGPFHHDKSWKNLIWHLFVSSGYKSKVEDDLRAKWCVKIALDRVLRDVWWWVSSSWPNLPKSTRVLSSIIGV